MKKIFLVFILVAFGLFAKAQIEQPVTWSYAAKKISKTEAILYIKANIEEGWHLYSQKVRPGGPIPTTFTFVPSKAFSRIGAVLEPKAITKDEKVFNMIVAYFEKSVIFQQKIKLKSTQSFSVKGKVEYMVCNDSQCLPPTEVEFDIRVK